MAHEAMQTLGAEELDWWTACAGRLMALNAL